MESNKKVIVNMDVIAEILSRLRAKDLTRFKSVCKSWLQLISTQDFIQLHLKRSSFRAHLQSTYFAGSPPHRNFLRHPQPQCQNPLAYVGHSCDGLACLLNKRLGIIHIWNPAIREYACFPTKKIRLPIICFWFGIHDDEYKLILGTRPCRMYDVDDLDDDDDDDDYDSEYEMHLIKPYVDSHSFKSTPQGLRKEEDQEFYDKEGTLFSGNVHWAVFSWHKKEEEEEEDWERGSIKYSTILCYNLREETVGRIAVPAQVEDYELGEMDGCFSALLFPDDYMGYEVWVMKEYGVEESWTKLMFIEGELGHALTYRSPLVSKEGCVESLVNPKTRH